MALRRATTDDLPWMMSLCEVDRIEKNTLHPIAHQDPAAFCRARRPEIERFLADPKAICLIRHRNTIPVAFLLARLVQAPPVYAPGGPVCLVEEFEVVRPPNMPAFGAELLDECRRIAKGQGAVLQRVVSTAGDSARESFLLSAGFTVASEWYHALTQNVRQVVPAKGTIRRAQPGDLPLIFAIGEKTRQRYAEYQPVFWRPATISIEAVAPYLLDQIEDEDNIALVHETRRGLDGFLIGAHGVIDDFALSRQEAWGTAGAALLAEASRQAAEKGTERLVVISGHLDQPKRSMLVDLGFELVTNWYVRNF